MIKPNYVTIQWGKFACEKVKYRFDTEKEMANFIFGVNQAVGWLDCKIVDMKSDKKFKIPTS